MSISVNEQRNATVTSVASSASSTTLFAGDKRAVGVYIFNASTQVLYIKLGATASAADYSHSLASGGSWQVPFNYNGRIDGIWASANGVALVTAVV